MSKRYGVLGLGVFVVVIGIAVWVLGGKDSAPIGMDTEQAKKSDEKIDVVASFYPLAFLAKEVGGDRVQVRDIAGNHEVHEYTPSPQDVIAMNSADVVLYLGAGIEPWVADMEPEMKSKNIPMVEVASFVLSDEDIREAEEHEAEESRKILEDSDHATEHEDEENHEPRTVEDDHAAQHGDVNPHIWLDPVFMERMADGVAQSFSSVDPGGSAVYSANAESLKNKLANLDEEYRTTLSSCTRGDVIVSHDALGRMADRYGFTTTAIAGISTEDEPSAQTLAGLKAKAAEGGVAYILTEEAATARFAEALSRETGLGTLTINTLEFDPSEGQDYVGVMEDNLKVLAEALGCN